jgi:hypothetical protein
MQQCDLIIPKNQTKHLTHRKPQPPLHKAQIKIHKPGNPIRPVVNKRTAPTYKVAKLFAKKLNDYTHLTSIRHLKKLNHPSKQPNNSNTYPQTGNLVPEQNSNEKNSLFQLIIDRMPPLP